MFGVPQITRAANRINLNDTPLQIPDLGLWLRADAATVLNSIAPNVACTDGQAVRRWMDQSGNGRHFDQSIAANQPLFRTSGIGGQAAVDFDGVNDVVAAVSGGGLLNAAPGATLFCVSKPDSATVPGNQTMVFFSTGGGSTRARLARLVSGATGHRAEGRREDADANVGVTSRVTFSASAGIDFGRFRLSDAQVDAGMDGVVVSGAFHDVGAFSGIDSSQVTVGGAAASELFPGHIAEVIVYPRALTDVEVWTMHRYLSLRYGITLAV